MPKEQQLIDVREFNPESLNKTGVNSIEELLMLLSLPLAADKPLTNAKTAKIKQNVSNVALPSQMNSKGLNPDNLEHIARMIKLFQQDKRNLQEPTYQSTGNSKDYIDGESIKPSLPPKRVEPGATTPILEILAPLLLKQFKTPATFVRNMAVGNATNELSHKIAPKLSTIPNETLTGPF